MIALSCWHTEAQIFQRKEGRMGGRKRGRERQNLRDKERDRKSTGQLGIVKLELVKKKKIKLSRV